MNIFKHMKQSYQNYLSRLEKSNKELFGNSTPDCCKLNRSTNKKYSNK